MKFHLQTPSSFLVTALGDDWIRIGTTEYHENIVLTPDAIHAGWAPTGFGDLDEAAFAGLRQYDPEIVLLGTGARQVFPPPALVRSLTEARIGFEPMDTRAACRTFNILMAEGRRVVAALILK
ncbi:MAG: Mth938-like domain-containing protein [Betaproteobacteria bacterium]